MTDLTDRTIKLAEDLLVSRPHFKAEEALQLAMELDSLVAKQRQELAAKANLEALERKLFQSRCYPDNIEEDEKIGGVYALFAEKELVYIGQSNDIHYRVLAHLKNGKLFTLIRILKVENEFLRDRLELALIHKHQPRLNIQGVTRQANLKLAPGK